MTPFVSEKSIVREIWGNGDTILLIFAGAAAEFALNKAVDWLYFTGRLPADPLGRLFSTVGYARRIVFSDTEEAHKAIDTVRAIHGAVEEKRGAVIPDWAYRDVLFMLVHYSIASFEVLERKLTMAEKDEVCKVFFRVGHRMGIKDLPTDYKSWLIMHGEHQENDLIKSEHTLDLYKQYRKHLGTVRYKILLEGQKLVVPPRVNDLLNLGKPTYITPLLYGYKLSRRVKLDEVFKAIILPPKYKKEIRSLDRR
ncbi:MAG TPA: oxygenase MpaB family protein [Chitinophagaceae bacterium]|nr:oxygenase MpaB family protein [Chitinophagaceae bacterium]